MILAGVWTELNCLAGVSFANRQKQQQTGCNVIRWLTIREAAALLPSKPQKETLRLWVTRGSKRSDGVLVKLKGTRIGGRWFTRKRWLREYIAAVSAVPVAAAETLSGAFPESSDWEAEQRAAARKLGRTTKGKS